MWVALARMDGAGLCNCGIVDLGGRVIVFDTMLTTQASLDLLLAAQTLTGQSVTTVINSHWHRDHVQGNFVFPTEADVMATLSTRTDMITNTPVETETHQKNVNQTLADAEAALTAAADPAEREEKAIFVKVLRILAEDAPGLRVRLPNVVFEDHLVLHGTQRRAVVQAMGGGHSASDSILWLPDDGIAFVADLLFNRVQPPLNCDGSVDEWLSIVDQLEALEPPLQTIIPGHGDVGSRELFGMFRDYVAMVRAFAADRAVDEPDMPAEYTTWHWTNMFQINIDFLRKDP
ncbi:MAG: MBL fold metallo-hydrolase [Chloroflexi bacterium]|nr:MBL fold metallo-hydrolase [Chloroflexota bacterium]